MILYANGCSHTAAAEAVVEWAFAEDDSQYYYLGRKPHPANLKASWCTHLADSLDAELVCDAESAASNDRIIRTTLEWIDNNPTRLTDTFMILQWSTWEREEWLYKDTWYQVNASGIDLVPPELQNKYKQYVIDIDWPSKTKDAHQKIWDLHCKLDQLGIKHLFYNSHSTFSEIHSRNNWNNSYIDPYSVNHSYNAILQQNGFEYANPKSYHFGADGHCFWAKYMLQYCIDNQII
jgi:hypothetical protein